MSKTQISANDHAITFNKKECITFIIAYNIIYIFNIILTFKILIKSNTLRSYLGCYTTAIYPFVSPLTISFK